MDGQEQLNTKLLCFETAPVCMEFKHEVQVSL